MNQTSREDVASPAPRRHIQQTKIFAFVPSANVVCLSPSTFCASVTALRPSQSCHPSRKHNRARIVALGPAPASPPADKEPEKETDKNKVVSDADTKPEETAEPETAKEVTADDILNSPSFLKKKLEIVQKELTTARKELETKDESVEDEKSRYIRLAADFENFRRRSMEDLGKQESKTTAKVCKEIVQVLDNFQRAISAVQPETEREKTISGSYQAINRQMLEALSKLKVKQVDAVGELFNPSLHEAIQKMESTKYAEDVVCEQFSKGYQIGDVLIRPAVVAVSSGPGPKEEKESKPGPKEEKESKPGLKEEKESKPGLKEEKESKPGLKEEKESKPAKADEKESDDKGKAEKPS